MGDRLDLHAKLISILGSNHVYFQPPENVKMNYPAIVYRRDYADTTFADNNPYSVKKRYLVTYIDKNPDSDIPNKIADLPTCIFDRFYTADNLNHDTYKLYF